MPFDDKVMLSPPTGLQTRSFNHLSKAFLEENNEKHAPWIYNTVAGAEVLSQAG